MPLMASPSSHQSEVRPVPAPSNPVLLAAQSQWLFTDEELAHTPSMLDGMSMEAEHTSRSKGVNFIVQVGIMLKLPQLTLSTASVYLHRFFMRYSMVDVPHRPGIHPYPVAATSLFLASKMEENCRKMKEFVVACCRVAQKKPDLVVDEQSKEFWKWRDTILHTEDLLLEALCFDLQLEQPYRILYDFICFFGVNENKTLRNAAWAFVNDSTYTVLCLQFTARTIAASALYAAARLSDVAFEDDGAGRPWWEQIDVDISEVRRACNRIVQLYEKNSVHRQSHPYPTFPVEGGAVEETTRIARSPRISIAGTPTPSEGEVNGRKRSREPEERASLPPQQQQQFLKNGSLSFDSNIQEDRSPKRQRVAQDNNDANESKPNSSQVSTVSSDPLSSQTVNGYYTASTGTSTDNSQYYHSPQNSQQQLPFSKHHHDQQHHNQTHNHHHNRRHNPLPPPPPSASLPPPPPPPQYQHHHHHPSRRGSNSHEGPDPVQQRIDEIVQQGLSRNNNNSLNNGSGNDRYRPAWERDRDSDRPPWQRERRRSSATSGSGGGAGGRIPSATTTTNTTTTDQQRTSPPPAPLPRIPHRPSRTREEEEEEEEEEEGEIKEEDEGGGGSEEGEL